MRTITRLALAGLLVASIAPAVARAQATAEGTTITNTATATWTDANGNSYTPATASVSVTVGYLVGIDVQSAASVTPASPSTANTISFTINNVGNGTDNVTVGSTAGAGVTITGYTYGGTTYATLTDLNAALAAGGAAISAGGSATVAVVYTVAAGQGGATIPVTLSATSVRAPGAAPATDASTTNVIPTVSAGVAVTPDGGTIDRLPSNGTQYTQVFTIQNNGNATDLFNVVAATNGTGTVTVVSTSASSISLGAGASGTITVTYTVGNVAAGSTEPIRLTATSSNNAATSDQGDITVRVIRAALTMTKEAFRDNQTTAVTGTVLPGEYLQYRITITNSGVASATTIAVTDTLPSQLTYVSSAGDVAGWTIAQSSGVVSATLTGTLAANGSRYFWIRVRVK